MKEKRLSIPLLIALVGFPQISETIYTPSLPNVASSLQTTAYMVEATLAIYFIGFALGVLSWGIISDFLGRRKAMLIGLVIYGIGTLGCAKSLNIELLLSFRLIQAFGASVGSVITQTILRDAFDGAERTKLFSVMSGALAFSPAIGPVLGGVISEYFGWRANFSTLFIFSIFLMIWTWFILPETRPNNIVKTSISKIFCLLTEMIGSWVLWGHIFLISATNAILFGFYQEAPFVFIEQMGIKPSHYGFFGLLIALATILAARLSYRMSCRLSAYEMIRLGAIGVLIGSFVFTGILVLNLGITLTLLPLFLIFFGIGLIIPNSLSHALKPYQNMAGTAGSIFGGCYYCIIATCMWLMSALHDGTALPLPLYITALGLVVMVGSYMVQSRVKALD